VTNPANPILRSSSTLDFDALGWPCSTRPGHFVGAADDRFVNAVPLFDPRLVNTFNIDFSGFPGDVQFDANSTGIALGDGFGVVTTGSAGIQVFPLQAAGRQRRDRAHRLDRHARGIADPPSGFFLP